MTTTFTTLHDAAATLVPPMQVHEFNCPTHGKQVYNAYMRNGRFAAPHCPICRKVRAEERAILVAVKDDAERTCRSLQNLFGESLGGDLSSRDMTFARFTTSGSPYVTKARDLCRRFADRFLIREIEKERLREAGNSDWRKKNALGICLQGDCGVGKSFIANCILNRLTEIGTPGYFVSCPSLMQAIFDLPFGDKSRAVALLCHTSCLVLDDVGAQSWKPPEQQLLFQIIEGRVNQGRPIVATSNLKRPQMESCLTTRTAQRLTASTLAIDAFGWPNIRMKDRKTLTLDSSEDLF